MDSKLDQAREYAQWMIDNTPKHHQSKARAAAEVIQSLPDQWIDAEKVRALIASLNAWAEDADAERAHGRALGYRTAAENLAVLLPTPPLPTLADMTPEERQACQWMQAKIHRSDDLEGVIFFLTDDRAKIMFRDGTFVTQDHEDITPLPGLPPMKWPGSGDAPTVAEQENVSPDQQVNPQVKLDSSRPRTEDVPAGEPWLVKHDGHEWVGTRESRVEVVCSWALARLDGADYTVTRDTDITLVSRLVPEHKENA